MSHPHTLLGYDADAIAAWGREAPTAADDAHARVALLSPVAPGDGAVEIIPTWCADTPPGTWVELQLQARHGAGWGRRFRVAAWDRAPSESRRTSFEAQGGPDGRLATDTLLLSAPAEAVRARALLCAIPGAGMPSLERLALCLTAERAAPPALSPEPSALTMPLLLSQYLSYPDYGHLWCSPTALTMVLAYWHDRTGDPRLAPFLAPQSVPATTAPMVYDPGWEGTGNWAFNTAFAASLGLTAYVTRMHSLAQLSRWAAAGVPVIISVRWEPGELEGAAGRSDGHMTIVRGFAADRALIAEPAAREVATIARSYQADQLFACWQRASSGAAYLIHPQGWPTPPPGPGDAWL